MTLLVKTEKIYIIKEVTVIEQRENDKNGDCRSRDGNSSCLEKSILFTEWANNIALFTKNTFRETELIEGPSPNRCQKKI